MDKNNKQHVQLPNNMTEKLTPQDILIYLTIKRYMNGETKEAFPSLETIKMKSGASIPTVRKCIDNLKAAKYIEVKKQGRQNIYKFLQWDKFEPFSYDFLDKEDLTFTEKAYIAASQQFMFKDIEGIGKISAKTKVLSNTIKMPEKTIYQCDANLKRKGYLTIIENELRDKETGCKTRTKVFNLAKLCQAVIWTLKDHEERIQENTDSIAKLTKTIENQNKLISKMQEKIDNLENTHNEFRL